MRERASEYVRVLTKLSFAVRRRLVGGTLIYAQEKCNNKLTRINEARKNEIELVNLSRRQ